MLPASPTLPLIYDILSSSLCRPASPCLCSGWLFYLEHFPFEAKDCLRETSSPLSQAAQVSSSTMECACSALDAAAFCILQRHLLCTVAFLVFICAFCVSSGIMVENVPHAELLRAQWVCEGENILASPIWKFFVKSCVGRGKQSHKGQRNTIL